MRRTPRFILTVLDATAVLPQTFHQTATPGSEHETLVAAGWLLLLLRVLLQVTQQRGGSGAAGVSSAGPAPAAVGDEDDEEDAEDDDEEASQPQHRGKQRPSTTTTLCPVRAATAGGEGCTQRGDPSTNSRETHCDLTEEESTVRGNLSPLPNNLLQRSKCLYCVFISTQVASGASMAGPLNQLCTTRTQLQHTQLFLPHTTTRELLGPNKNPVLYCFKSQIHHNIPCSIAYPSVYPIS